MKQQEGYQYKDNSTEKATEGLHGLTYIYTDEK